MGSASIPSLGSWGRVERVGCLRIGEVIVWVALGWDCMLSVRGGPFTLDCELDAVLGMAWDGRGWRRRQPTASFVIRAGFRSSVGLALA